MISAGTCCLCDRPLWSDEPAAAPNGHCCAETSLHRRKLSIDAYRTSMINALLDCYGIAMKRRAFNEPA